MKGPPTGVVGLNGLNGKKNKVAHLVSRRNATNKRGFECGPENKNKGLGKPSVKANDLARRKSGGSDGPTRNKGDSIKRSINKNSNNNKKGDSNNINKKKKKKLSYDNEDENESPMFVKQFKNSSNQKTVSFDDVEMANINATTEPSSNREIFSDATFASFGKQASSTLTMGTKVGVVSKRVTGSATLLSQWLLNQLKDEGYNQMTRIQHESIPRILNGSDVMIRCETGSGKTLAFVVPAIQYLLGLTRLGLTKPFTRCQSETKGSDKNGTSSKPIKKRIKEEIDDGPDNDGLDGGEAKDNKTSVKSLEGEGLGRSLGTQVLVLAPTRELVNQTISVATRLTIPFPQIVVSAITGGEKRKSEKARLRKGVTLLGSTVGRICDHLDTTSSFVIRHLGMLVLDEADRLLDMGFEKRLRWIVRKLKEVKEEQENDNNDNSDVLMKDEVDSDDDGNDRTQQPLVRCMDKQRGIVESRLKMTKKAQPPLMIKETAKTESDSAKSFQTVLVSATLTPSVKRLADFVLSKDAEWVSMDGTTSNVADNNEMDQSELEGSKGEAPRAALNSGKQLTTALTIPAHLKQYYVEISLKTRLITLMSIILEKGSAGKVVVFLSNRESVDFHHSLLQSARWPNERLFESKTFRHQQQPLLKGVKSSKAGKESWNSTQNKGRIGSAGMSSNGDRNLIDDGISSSDSDSDDDDDESNVSKEQRELELVLGDQICANISVFKLHGNLTQAERLGYLSDFNKREKEAVLLTTDVASRGLNLTGVQWVVQVDPPQEVEEYVHRVGRTGRIGNEGFALLFLQQHELGYLSYLRHHGVHLRPTSELQLVQPMCQSFLPDHLRRRRFHNIPKFMTSFISKQVSADIDLLHGARRSFTASSRGYRCYGQEFKEFFNVQSLHLGHLANAFCLKETPLLIGKKCRMGVMAAAARKLISERREQKSHRGRKTTDGDQIVQRHKTSNVSKGLGRVAGGILHDSTKATIPKKVTIQSAQQILKAGGTKTTGRPNKGLRTQSTLNNSQKSLRSTRDENELKRESGNNKDHGYGKTEESHQRNEQPKVVEQKVVEQKVEQHKVDHQKNVENQKKVENHSVVKKTPREIALECLKNLSIRRKYSTDVERKP